MPNGDYKWPTIGRTEFERALQIILNDLTEQAEKQRKQKKSPFRQAEWWAGRVIPGIDRPEEYYDNLYNEIMDMVDRGGVPAIEQAYPDIWKLIMKPRAERAWGEEYGERTVKAEEDYQKAVEQAVSQQWSNQFAVQKWEQSEAWRRYGAETQQQRWKAEQEYKKSQDYLGLMRQREMTRTAQYNWGQQRFARQFGGGQQEWQMAGPGQYQGNLPAPQQQQMSQAWNEWNSRLAGGASWPQSEFLQQAANPYTRKREGRWDEVQELESDLAETKIRADAIRSRMKDPNDPLTQAGDFAPETPEQQSAFGVLMREAVLERELKRAEKGVASDMGPGEARETGEERLARKFPSVQTPAFLRGIYPNLGAELPHKGMWERQGFKPPMGALSGQQWGGMLPSQRQQWAGYIGWAGGKPEDLYAQMRGALPEPRQGGRWKPARQWRT